MAVILASASPRRRELLEMLGVRKLTVIPARGEERAPEGAPAAEAVEAISRAKALEVAEQCSPGDVIIAADTVVCGLGFESLLSPMPIEIETQNGQSVLRNKAIGELRIRLYDSVGGEAKCGGDSWQKIVSRDVLDDFLDSAIARKDEVVTLNMLSGFEQATSIEVRQTDPLPFNVNSMVVGYDVSER